MGSCVSKAQALASDPKVELVSNPDGTVYELTYQPNLTEGTTIISI
jgi:hypothetical protein